MNSLLKLQKIRRSICVLGSALLVGGCGNCSIMSQHQSLGCNAQLAGLVVLVAPAALASAAFEGAHDRSSQRKQRRLVEAGDREATVNCVWYCLAYDHVKDARALRQNSAERVIGWWDDGELTWDKASVVMKALLLRSKTRMDADPASAEKDLRRAAVMSADPRILGAMKSTAPDSSADKTKVYDLLVEEIQSSLILLRYRGIPGRAGDPSELSTNCRAVAAWPPAWYQGNQSKADGKLGQICLLSKFGEDGSASFSDKPVIGRDVIDPERD